MIYDDYCRYANCYVCKYLYEAYRMNKEDGRYYCNRCWKEREIKK